MNHRTEAEEFRARLAALSRPQLEEAMRYLRIVDSGVVERALAFAATPFTAPDDARLAGLHSAVGDLALPDCDDAAEFSHIAIEGIALG